MLDLFYLMLDKLSRRGIGKGKTSPLNKNIAMKRNKR